jgi:branched-chain amino acid aminotransferase
MGVYAPDNPIRAFIVAYRWGTYLGAEALVTSIRVKISSWQRHHHGQPRQGQDDGPVPTPCSKAEAKLSGYDEAVLLDTQGYVSEGSGEHLHRQEGPARHAVLSGSILAGVTRDTVLTLARGGIPTVGPHP